MWTQAAGVVQVLGEPVQVPVQPVEVALVRTRRAAGRADKDQKQGGYRVEMPEEGNGRRADAVL